MHNRLSKNINMQKRINIAKCYIYLSSWPVSLVIPNGYSEVNVLLCNNVYKLYTFSAVWNTEWAFTWDIAVSCSVGSLIK